MPLTVAGVASEPVARVYGLEVIRLASADVLPFDYEQYGKEIAEYLKAAELKSQSEFGQQSPSFAEAEKAAQRIEKAGGSLLKLQGSFAGDPGVLNLVPNPDTIQETSIQTNTYAVDYGRASSVEM